MKKLIVIAGLLFVSLGDTAEAGCFLGVFCAPHYHHRHHRFHHHRIHYLRPRIHKEVKVIEKKTIIVKPVTVEKREVDIPRIPPIPVVPAPDHKVN